MMITAHNAKITLMSACAFAAMLSTGCASIPAFGGNSEIAAKYQADIDKIKDYPTASQIIKAPANQNTQEQWDAKAKTLLDLEKVFTDVERQPFHDTATTQARARQLREKLNAYTLDDY